MNSSSASQFFLDDANDLTSNFELERNIDNLPEISVQGHFWPVNGVLTSHFGKWRGSRKRGRYHIGVDIAAPHGTPILAPLNGSVIYAGRKGGYGLTVILDHGNGLATLYGHNSKLEVKEGDQVRKGQIISRVGSTGHSTGPHLHYEVRLEGHPVNPLAWTKKLQTERF